MWLLFFGAIVLPSQWSSSNDTMFGEYQEH
jgi:hypothetical protein